MEWGHNFIDMYVINLNPKSPYLPLRVEADPGEAPFIPQAERDGIVHPASGARRDRWSNSIGSRSPAAIRSWDTADGQAWEPDLLEN
jgi:hypothetical protein